MAAQFLLGMGNPLLDISADVTEEKDGKAFLEKYEFKMNNAILCSEKEAGCYKEMVDKFKCEYIAGGATQNSIRVCQWVLESKAGSTGFIGCVGKDAYGKQLAESAAADGVKTFYLEDDKEPTGTCAVVIQDKERSLCANLAAANCYKVDHMKEEAVAKETWQKATHVYCAGFFLTVSPEAINFAGKHCNEEGKVFCMNLSAIFIVDFFTEKLMEALKHADYLFGNESEAEAFGKKMGYTDCSIANIAKEISKIEKYEGAKNKSRTVVITQGGDPTIIAVDGVVTEFPTPPLAADKIVDSNGAGDSFVGGFLAAMMSGKDTPECVKYGIMGAQAILGVSGCDLKAAGKPSMAL